jgi:hypothetical protein
MAEEKSPFKILGAVGAFASANPALAGTILSAGSSLLGGIFGGRRARKAQRAAERRERMARTEMNRLKQVYSNLDTSNPYLNMENVMEDLTVNQKQAQFERQQFQQSQANILSGLRDAAGGSGVAAVAQALAQQGQLQAQRSAASIGAQESRNQMLRQREAGRLQTLERQGELISRAQERQKVTGLLSMSQAETAAYGQQAAAAQQARYDAIGGAFSGVAQAGIAGLQAGAFDNIQGVGRQGVDMGELPVQNRQFIQNPNLNVGINTGGLLQDINMPGGTSSFEQATNNIMGSTNLSPYVTGTQQAVYPDPYLTGDYPQQF